jgi:hypothetical protein
MIVTIFLLPYGVSFVIEMIYDMKFDSCSWYIDICICYSVLVCLLQSN